MFRDTTSTLIWLLAASALPVALGQSTTIEAFFAPPRVAASVVTVDPTATTFALKCTAGCSSILNGAGTVVNGPKTAGFTQVWKDDGEVEQKTLIIDCAVSDNGKGNCVVKAASSGLTGTLTKETSFSKSGIMVTAGLEKLGIVIATTTTEVNTTVTAKKTSTKETPEATHSSSSNSTSSASSFSNSTSTSTDSSTSRVTPSRTATLPASTGAVSTTSANAAAATLTAERVGGALLGLAGLFLVAL